MSRYIDADALFDAMEKTEWYNNADRDEIAERLIMDAPSIDIVCCRECIYYDPPHVEDHDRRIEYKDLPREAFDELGTGLVNVSYGVNIGGRCCVDYNCGYAEDKRVYRAEDNFCGKGRKALYSSEKPNNSMERSSE